MGPSKYLFKVTSRNRRRRRFARGRNATRPTHLPFLPTVTSMVLPSLSISGSRIEHVVGLRRRDDDVEAGIGLGEAVGQLRRSLNHQHLNIAFGFEIGQHAGQTASGPLIDRARTASLSGSLSFCSDSGSITAVTPSLTGPAGTTRLGRKTF